MNTDVLVWKYYSKVSTRNRSLLSLWILCQSKVCASICITRWQPVLPPELSQLRRALTEERHADAGEGDLQNLYESDSSLDDSGISDTPPERRRFFGYSRNVLISGPLTANLSCFSYLILTYPSSDPVYNNDIFASSRDSTLTQSRELSPLHPRDMAWREVTRERSRVNTSPKSRIATSPNSRVSTSPDSRNAARCVRRPLQSSLRHFSTSWGSRGAGPGHLDTPTGLCVVSQTQVWIF